jgi:hypothetical protein
MKSAITRTVRHCLVLLVAFMVLCQSALAQQAAPPAPPPPEVPVAAATSNIQSVSIISAMVSSIVGTGFAMKFINSGKSMAGKFTQGALTIAGALALMTLMWEITINMKDGKPVLEGVVETVMFCAVVMFLVSKYTLIVDDLRGIGEYIVQQVAGGDIGAAVSQFISTFLVKIFQMVSQSWTELTKLKSVFEIIDALLALVLSLAAFGFALMATVEILSVALVGPFTFALGIALGPFFICTLVSSWTRRWFDQWINFMVNAACLTGILAIALAIISTAVITGSPVMSTITSDSLAAEALGMALFASIMGKLISAVPNYADALFPGRTSAGSAVSRPNIKPITQALGGLTSGLRKGAGTGNSASTSMGAGFRKWFTP